MVKGASDVMNDVCDDERPSNNGRVMVSLDDDACAAIVRADVGKTGIRLEVHPSKNFCVESIEQFFSAI
jgi:hypothetical protein